MQAMLSVALLLTFIHVKIVKAKTNAVLYLIIFGSDIMLSLAHMPTSNVQVFFYYISDDLLLH